MKNKTKVILKKLNICDSFHEMVPGLKELREVSPDQFDLFWYKIKNGKWGFLYNVLKSDYELISGEKL